MASSRGARRATLSGRRYSACAEASRAALFARIRAMSAVERMELALALGRRRCELLALRVDESRGGG